MPNVTVYGIRDAGGVFYVGSTSKTFAHRRQGGYSRRVERRLARDGWWYVELERVPASDRRQAEQRWIDEFRRIGELCNAANVIKKEPPSAADMIRGWVAAQVRPL